jgi:hypothetical protein
MYQTSSAVAERIMSHSRTWRVWLENAATGEMIAGETVTSASGDSTSTSLTDDIEIGAVTCASWTVELRRRTSDLIGQKFRLYFYLKDLANEGFTTWGDLGNYTCGELDGMTVAQIAQLGEVFGERIPMGVFTCIRAPRSGDGRQLTLVDEIYFADVPYVRSVTLPQPASVIEQDVCRQLGIVCAAAYDESYLLAESGGELLATSDGYTLATASYDFLISRIPTGATCRQVLGYIAGARGEFGCIDREGRYTRRWYAPTGYTIDADHADEPTVSEQANVIVGIRCRNGGNTYECGEMSGGRVLEFENPYVDAQLLSTIFGRVRRLSWYTCEVTHRLGDPRLDTGDIVTVGDGCAIPVTGLRYSFDGGLMAEISAAGINETEQQGQ